MNDTRTVEMLQRVPAILAVTASSYGLPLRAAGARRREAAGHRGRNEHSKTGDKPAAHR